ncbi:MAG TPA: hypothetical protein DDW19_02245 [Anaerolineaceae bacterium]|nr:hypothetical protein [Anaerolineaceae bacterium]
MDEKTANTKMNEAREHLHAAHENMHKVAEAMIPEGMREHQREARKEFLLGIRSLLDVAIEHAEKQPK